MPTIEATIILKQDGVDVPGFPITMRAAVVMLENYVDGALPNDVFFHPFGGLTTIQNISFVRALDQPVTVRLNGQTDAGADLTAGGLIFVFGGVLDASIPTNLTVKNTGSDPGAVQVLVGGT